MRKLAILSGLAAACAVCIFLGVRRSLAERSPDQPRRVKVLFLGDTGHHQPLERLRDVYTTMGRRGIDFTYSQSLDDLNPKTLGRYDVLLLYANWTTISPDQEKALIDYVESGHGFAPIHCGSYCFLNSRKITALVGGRFKSHSTGVFKETIVQPDHPIEKGLKPIESWDETYVHEMHNEEGRQVLGYREEAGKKEPYTWVRTQGKGRVFYTAWGHDRRTWTNPDFENLLERGIRWAAGDWALAPQPALKPFTYVHAEIPNYPAGRPWGTTDKPFDQMQEPVSPQESMKHLALPPGFDVKLFCSEPQVKKPICMAFDERGRLWVAETFDYPNEMQKPGEGHDQITICEDTKGTGQADKFTVFADKLSIPTSMVFANGGVIVTQAPDILFLKSSKGDDHADVRQVLFHGFGVRDTHAGPSNLRWGFDNWIYGTCGYSGFVGTVEGQRVSFGQGVFRFKPDGSKLEFLGSSTNNTWGLGFSEDNQIFGSTANADPSFYLSIPNRYYEQVRGWPATRMESIADTWHFYPITDKVRQVDQHGGYTAGAGHALYTARSFPTDYWNRIAFVAEPTGHLLGQFVLEPDGSGFKARNDFNLLASDDEWTAPISAEVGPDGALWMIDWYNYIVQHNPIPKGFESGKGGAYITPLRDKRHGRVYRITWTDGKPSKTFDLSKANTEQLVEALKSDNMLWRTHAQRLLTERQDKAAIPALLRLVADQSVDEVGLNAPAIHALWTIHALGGFDGGNADATQAAVAALKHPSAGVRRAALDVLPKNSQLADLVIDQKLLADADAQVRKAALLALAEAPASERAGEAIYAALSLRQNTGDRGITDAAAIAACRHDAGFLRAAFAAHQGHTESGPVKTELVNVIPNPSFEEVNGQRPLRWRIRDYSGSATHSLDSPGHVGEHCLKITSDTGADASMFVDAPVEAGTEYRLSGWIKVQNLVRTSGLGALFNVHLMDVRTPAVSGTSDWQKVEVIFNTGDATRVSINCLFGGWGHAKGTAWFDDVELVRLRPAALPGTEGRVVGVVTSQYARRGPVDSVVATLSAVKQADPSLAAVVVSSLASGWPQGSAPKLSDADVAELHRVMEALAPESRDRLLALAERWGRRDVFNDAAVAITSDLKSHIADSSLDPAKRADSARRLIAIDDSANTAADVLKNVTPKEPPDVQIALLDALGDSKDAGTGQAMVNAWPQLTPSAQKETINLLLKRVPWSAALLGAIESGKINNSDLQPQHWQTLISNLDASISEKAKALQKATGRAPTADRKELVQKLLPLADKPGDVARGKLAFEKNCMVCHTLEGKGGKVGPDLTGIGARGKADNLIDIIDPNRSVEGTYRQWIVKTKDDVVSGRLYAESRTSIEIIDAAAQTHTIQREEIQVLKATDKSVMPEGFESLSPEDLSSLLEYLAQSRVKH